VATVPPRVLDAPGKKWAEQPAGNHTATQVSVGRLAIGLSGPHLMIGFSLAAKIIHEAAPC